jgi:hypothetical protein
MLNDGIAMGKVLFRFRHHGGVIRPQPDTGVGGTGCLPAVRAPV